MPIVRWFPRDLTADQFFADFFVPTPPRFSPAPDVYEDKDNLIVETALPGVDAKDVKVEIEDNVLTISGQSSHRREVDEKNFYRKEVRLGAFFRSVALPKAVRGDSARATYEQGMLTITIPKTEEAKPKRIAIHPKNG